MVIATLLVVAALVLPWLAKRKARSSRINCINNLKQIGVGFRSWALDQGDRFPMRVSVTNWGTMEFCLTTNVFVHFQALSNELNTPRILHCPNDTGRIPAVTFTNGIGNSNISYFVGLDADQTRPDWLLAGDRNVTDGPLPASRMIQARSNCPISWTREVHDRVGNIVLADGSAQSLISTRQLREVVNRMGAATNRLAIP